MGEFVTLTCPSCGGKLEIGQTIEQFACQFCGNEHLVKRGGGIVSLQPVVDGLEKVRRGTDRTADELAIRRLKEEVQALQNQDLPLRDQRAPLQVRLNKSGVLIWTLWLASLILCFFGFREVFRGGATGGSFLLVTAGLLAVGGWLARAVATQTKRELQDIASKREHLRTRTHKKESDIRKLLDRANKLE